THYRPDFKDPRDNQNKNDDRNWGPLPTTIGRWNGVYSHNNQAILHYTIQETEIHELPSSISFENEIAFTRTLRTTEVRDTIFNVIAEFTDSDYSEIINNIAYFYHHADTTKITAVGLNKDKSDS